MEVFIFNETPTQRVDLTEKNKIRNDSKIYVFSYSKVTQDLHTMAFYSRVNVTCSAFKAPHLISVLNVSFKLLSRNTVLIIRFLKQKLAGN